MARWAVYPSSLRTALHTHRPLVAVAIPPPSSAQRRRRSTAAQTSYREPIAPLELPKRARSTKGTSGTAMRKQKEATRERVPTAPTTTAREEQDFATIDSDVIEELSMMDMAEVWADYEAELGPTTSRKTNPTPSPAPTIPPPPTKSTPRTRATARKEPPLEPLSLHTITPLENQIRTLHDLFPNDLLLTQVGSFYESYFAQAPLIARLLSLKLTSKVFGKSGEKIRHAFCGFPLNGLEKALSTLVEAGHRVVVVQEVKDSEGVVARREVVRVVTPGTGVDEAFVKKEEWNFVLAIGLAESDDGLDDGLSLAYRDISTGTSFTKNSSMSKLRDDILVLNPKEIVVSSNLATTPLGARIKSLLNDEQEREAWMVSDTELPVSSGATPSASLVLASYLAATLLAHPPPLVEATFVDPTRILGIDSTTLKSLEIRESLRGGTKGSLLWSVKRTVTPGGSRLLAERLCSPSTDVVEIDSRLAQVQTFLHLPSARQYLRAILRPLDDTSRVLQRLYMRRFGAAFDLLALKKSLQGLRSIGRTLSDELEQVTDSSAKLALKPILDRLEAHDMLADIIEEAIDEEALVARTKENERRAELSEILGSAGAEKMLEEDREGEDERWGEKEDWVIRPATSEELQALHLRLDELRQAAFELNNSLKLRFKNQSLLLKIVPKFGAVVHVTTKTDGPLEKIEGVIRVVKTGSTRSYTHPEWTTLRTKIDVATAKIREMETRKIQRIVNLVLESYESLQKSAELLDELDVALGFAELAQEMNLVRPVVNDSTSLNIVAGRHPTVEYALKLQAREFKANSLHFSHPTAFVHCLTGPNMAGKSTFLRQNALIVVLAQAGSFVPAEEATIGIVDRIFSRVGARDELDRDRSTFMVEMDEAASILHSATEKSLVLFDELGRGTSPLDGLAIAYAALEHLVEVNRSRTLFATHYHRLGELLGYDPSSKSASEDWAGVEFWCTSVVEEKDSVAYDHTVRRGLNDDSAGLVIARLAKLPERAIESATMIREQVRKGRMRHGGEL